MMVGKRKRRRRRKNVKMKRTKRVGKRSIIEIKNICKKGDKINNNNTDNTKRRERKTDREGATDTGRHRL